MLIIVIAKVTDKFWIDIFLHQVFVSILTSVLVVQGPS